MCCGCGACAYIDPQGIEMADVLEHGRRPLVREGSLQGAQAREALEVCPGVALEHRFDEKAPGLIRELIPAWGPVLEVWEGYSADDEVRFAASSGGAATALALYCIERGGMYGALHINARADIPYLNETILSRSRDEMMRATGSRYAPASPCDGLQRIEDAPAACVFIGKPCDVAATSKARRIRPGLDAKLGLTIAIFCAGTPSTRGTVEMLKKMGVSDMSEVKSVRYRGNGWPGNAVARFDTPAGEQKGEMTYADSWGNVLQKYRQWRCYVCIDHSGEFADIAVGDPWYRTVEPGEAGRSLILVRTERGRQILKEAMAAGYITAQKADPAIVYGSQKGFPTVRGSVWGRILVSRLMGAAAPKYRNMPMFRFWLGKLSLKEKAQSIYGTIKRVMRKKLRHRASLERFEPEAITMQGAGEKALHD
jgi:coenzyme F420 hydrogenase subunit beta